MFIDKVIINARAGDGGNGCVSFRREKYVQRGGSVILVADANVPDLADQFFAPTVIAKRGQHGRGKNCTGRHGRDITVRVPIGTQVFRLGDVRREARRTNYRPGAAKREEETDHGPAAAPKPIVEPATVPRETRERVLIADLVENGQQFVLAAGGRGGRGNMSYRSSTNQAPREFEYGEPGEQLDVELELKTLADVGLVGFPNAGKSTLISKLTHAHPKIAAYPFTTKTPKVGVITYDDFERVRVADIPGLIEGAHEGKGLGHEFLRHIERCRVLVFIIDMAGIEGRDPGDDYRLLVDELKLHDPALLDHPRLIVANKMDLDPAADCLATFRDQLGDPEIHAISALEGTGLDELKLAIRRLLT